MNSYKLKISHKALKQLSKLDKCDAQIILAWLEKNIEGCENPRLYGKAFVENYPSAWCYRIGNYRALYEIRDNELIIYTFEIGHRKEVYKH